MSAMQARDAAQNAAQNVAWDVPAMTVVTVSALGNRSIRRTIRALAAQTIADRLEVILVAPDESVRSHLDRLPEAFGSFRIVAAGTIDNVDMAAAGVMPEARGPIIGSIEDHAFPDADWAETVLRGYVDEEVVAVGSAVLNANPGPGLSWSNILLAYSQWSETTPEGPIGWVSHHNGTFRRAALERFDPEDYVLWFNREGEIMRRLRDTGGTFRFMPSARVRHINPSSLGATCALRMDAGRLYAANRARDEGWGWPKRLAYAGLGPLIPAVRYLKMRNELFRPGSDLSEARHGPAMMVGLIFDGLGQMAGFLAGPGRARDRLATFEMDRMDHLCRSDRAVFAT